MRTGSDARTEADAAYLPPDRTLRGIGLAFALGGVLAVTYTLTGLGVPCPFKSATGLDCPACGGTRMAAALLEGDPVAAFRHNGFLLVLGAVFGYLWLAWILARLGVVRLPRPKLRSRTRWFIAYGILVGAVVFTVVRNLV